MSAVVPMERIEQGILFIRGQKVMLDIDLARLFGSATKRLNEQVRRNLERFPADFMFQLTDREKTEVVANCDHLKMIRFSHMLPYAFTEHGALMLANVLKDPRAVQASLHVVRAFVRLRELLATHKDLARKLAARRARGTWGTSGADPASLESKYDAQFRVVFDAICKLMAPPPVPPKRRIGFVVHDRE